MSTNSTYAERARGLNLTKDNFLSKKNQRACAFVFYFAIFSGVCLFYFIYFFLMNCYF